MRAVLDPSVLISGLPAPTGAPARLMVRWLAGDFELIVATSAAVLVFGDQDLLILVPELPICSPSDFLKRLDS